MPHTRATLRALQEKFDRELLTASTDEERYANREALKQQVQRLVATEGQVYLPALPRAVQDFSGTYVSCNVWVLFVVLILIFVQVTIIYTSF